MKISLNWLKEYINLDGFAPEKIGEILTEIGLEVEGLEMVEGIKGGLKGVVVGEIMECGKHPNADKLSLTKVSVGGDDLLQVVCGAPNVSMGQKVLVATVGTTLYDQDGNGFKIKEAKMRGELSQGMICAEDEIGMGSNHDGIMVLPSTTAIGTLASDYFNLENDYIYDIGLTPNRSDATSHLGVAKDLAAALKINYDHSGEVKLPELKELQINNTISPISVTIKNEKGCPRYSGLSITNIKVGESPDWIKKRLNSIGVRPINNIVDITNFILHEYGQPLHAFDSREVKNNSIIVKNAEEGDEFKSLDGIDRKLSNADLMICNGESEGMCIAGVFGGFNSGVTDQTNSLFLESAHFNAKQIRTTSTRHLLRTDAAMCFEKGSDPNITLIALRRAASLIEEYAGGTVEGDLLDIYPKVIEPIQIKVRYQKAIDLIGVEIPPIEIEAIFKAMDMTILSKDDHSIDIAVPTNKADVIREVDAIEELLRIYGFNKVPFDNKLKSSVTISEKPDELRLRNRIADYLIGNGFNEMMGLSLTQSIAYEKSMANESSEFVEINNTSNIHLNILRPEMLGTMMDAVDRNQKRQSFDLKLFEFGKSYLGGNEFDEQRHLTIGMTGQRWSENWSMKSNRVTFYSIKAMANNVLQSLGITKFQESEVKDDRFQEGILVHRGKIELVSFGLIKQSILTEKGIKGELYFADFHWDNIIQAVKSHKINYEELSKYPSMRRDLALVVDNYINFNDIVYIARKTGSNILQKINLFDVYRNDEQLGANKKSYAISLHFQEKNKTLKDKEVDKIIAKLIEQFETKLKANIRR